MSSIGYRAEIDGLRAFAVVPVILFHMGFSWIAGGYIGVDVFFVISGFLITSILAKEIGEGSFSFREFWARRIRRILPAMIVVSAATLGFAYLFVFKGDHSAIGKQALSALFSVANVYFWRTTGDYWGTQAEESPFLHTWSLSVEEQFYVLFPLTLSLVVRFRLRWMTGIMLFVILSSFGLFLYGVSTHPTATFYLLPTRAWELGTGCLLAVLCRGNRLGGPNAERFASLALAGLCMVMMAYYFLPQLNGGLAIAILGTALIIAFGRSGICHAILAQRPVVHVGKISYSLYLWHWPVLVFAAYLGFHSNKWLLLIPIYLLSVASYHFVERPSRRRSGIIPWIAVGYLLTLLISTALATYSGVYDTSAFERPSFYGLFYDLKPETEELDENFRRIAGTSETPRREHSPDAFVNGGIIVGSGDANPKIVVLGDSHGVMWSDAIRSATEKLGIKTSFYSMNGVSPFVKFPLSRNQEISRISPKEKYQYDKARLDFIRKWQPQLVILCSRWWKNDEFGATELLDFLEEHASNVLLMEQPPELTFGSRNALQFLCFQNVKPETGIKQYSPTHAARDQMKRSLVRKLANRYSSFGYIPIYELYTQDSQALVLDGKQIVYVDDNHLTTYGAQLAAPRIQQIISETLKTNAPQSGRQMVGP